MKINNSRDLLVPSPSPVRERRFGPHPSAHNNTSSKQGNQVKLQYGETGVVLQHTLLYQRAAQLF